MSSYFDSGGFDDIAPASGGFGGGGGSAARPSQAAAPAAPFAGMMGGGGYRPAAHDASMGGLRDRPPTWVPDASVTGCGAPDCGTQFDTFERRHHCRYCGLVFCGKCTEATSLMPPQWEGGCGFSTRDPQRVCGQCRVELEPHQRKWIEQNCNANRTNALDLNDSTTRYLNSPLRFTLGGEVRKAGYALKNLTDGVNVWDRDLEYFDQQLQAFSAPDHCPLPLGRYAIRLFRHLARSFLGRCASAAVNHRLHHLLCQHRQRSP